MESPKQAKHFFTKVVGVSHRNPDSTSRQAAIKTCHVLERLVLDRGEDNPRDANSVKVCRENGQQLGYLSSALAGEIVRKSARGNRSAVFIINPQSPTPMATRSGPQPAAIHAPSSPRTRRGDKSWMQDGSSPVLIVDVPSRTITP
jgi:hypothetical protein